MEKKLLVYWQNNLGEKTVGVDTLEEAHDLVDEWTQEDLEAGDLVTWNTFGLQEIDEDGDPVEYYDEEGNDFDEIHRARNEALDEV